MSPLSRARTIRLSAGIVVTIAAAVGVAALVAADLPGHTRDTISVIAQPPAEASTATCAGPLLATGADATQAALLTDAAAPTVTSAASDGAVIQSENLASPDVSGGAGPTALTAEPGSGSRADLSAASSARVAGTDLRGFAAAACTRAAMESWLVGGAGTTGAADLVVLANPGDVAASVDLAVYGATGRTLPATGKGLVVAAHTQRVVPLAALALGEENPVIQVTATQAPVQASLQASLTRVLVPGGVDQIAATGSPADEIVIPGVSIALSPDDPAASDVVASVRLLAPSVDGAATVTVIGPSGPVGAAQTVPLTGGVPLELDLGDIGVGTYAVSVSATTPITGAVWSTTGFGAGSDFGWFTAADVLAEPTLIAVADGPSPQLTLTSGSAETQTVTVASDAGSGTAREVSVPAGGVAVIDADPSEVYLVTPPDAAVRLRVGVSFSGTGELAGYPAQAGDAAAAAIRVYPR